MISNRCARKSLVTNCNSIISKNYLRFLVDSNDLRYLIMISQLVDRSFFYYYIDFTMMLMVWKGTPFRGYLSLLLILLHLPSKEG